DLLGHRAIVAKEMKRPSRMQGSSRHESPIGVHTWPLLHALDELVFYRVRCRVDNLIDNGLEVEKTRDARFLGRPEVLPTASKLVLTSSNHLVEMLYELGDTSVTIEDHRVVVV